MNKLFPIPSQHCRAILPLAATIDARRHPAGLVRHIDLLNMGMPDFTMGEAISGNKNPMQASGWGAESRPVCAMKLVEMERDKLISARVLQIADKAVSDTDTVFATNLLGIENCRTNARWQLLQTFAGQV